MNQTQKDIINSLTALWEFYPMLRFNQMLHNLQMEYANGAYVKECYIEEKGWGMHSVSLPDLFYVEDEPFLEFLLKKEEEWKNGKQ